MSVDTVRAYLEPFGLADRVREFETSSATVELAAQAAGVIPARIAKSLSFMLPDGPILVVAAGDAKVDNPRFKAQFHAKARMLSFDECAALIGHDVRTYLDESLRRFDTVFPACGSANSAIELAPDRLAEVAQAFSGWVDVCKAWREE